MLKERLKKHRQGLSESLILPTLGIVAIATVAMLASAPDNLVKPIKLLDCDKNPGELGSTTIFIGRELKDYGLVAGQVVQARKPGTITINPSGHFPRQLKRLDVSSILDHPGLSFTDSKGNKFELSGLPSSMHGVEGTNLTVTEQCNPSPRP